MRSLLRTSLVLLGLLAAACLHPRSASGQQPDGSALGLSSELAASPAGGATGDSSLIREHLAGAGVPRTAIRHHRGTLFYAAMAVGTAATFAYRVDPDTGGYRDGWRTETFFPDKGVHALAAWALTSAGIDLGARRWIAAATVCAAGAAFEYSQGYVSRYDIGADCVGASFAALWRGWASRR